MRADWQTQELAGSIRVHPSSVAARIIAVASGSDLQRAADVAREVLRREPRFLVFAITLSDLKHGVHSTDQLPAQVIYVLPPATVHEEILIEDWPHFFPWSPVPGPLVLLPPPVRYRRWPWGS